MNFLMIMVFKDVIKWLIMFFLLFFFLEEKIVFCLLNFVFNWLNYFNLWICNDYDDIYIFNFCVYLMICCVYSNSRIVECIK